MRPSQYTTSDSAATGDRVPLVVRQLDVVYNARIANAQTDDALNIELRRKLTLKRMLDGLPVADVERYACEHLAQLARGR